MIPTIAPADIPYLSTDQMIEVDRAMLEDYHIDLIRMMESAGRNLAHLSREKFLDGEPSGRHVTVLAGTGGNGGGALVAARRLHNYGATVNVFTSKPDDAFTLVPGEQLDMLRRMDVTIGPADDVGSGEPTDLVLDGVIGYSLRGAPRGGAGELIRWANTQSSPVLSLDSPSGIDSATGTIFDPAVRATATMTLALPKEGLRMPGVQAHVGELYLADIGVPPELYKKFLGIDVGPIFATGDILHLVGDEPSPR
jgi:NAD(P)H-hydrate epimerase